MYVHLQTYVHSKGSKIPLEEDSSTCGSSNHRVLLPAIFLVWLLSRKGQHNRAIILGLPFISSPVEMCNIRTHMHM